MTMKLTTMNGLDHPKKVNLNLPSIQIIKSRQQVIRQLDLVPR